MNVSAFQFSLLLAFVSFFLGGCAVNQKAVSEVAAYDFGLPASHIVDGERWAALRLEVIAPTWADSLKVDYRLAYDEPLKQREYAHSRWVGAPSVLLATLLRQQLGAVGVSENIASRCHLTIELQEFSQVFSAPDESRGVLHAAVRLVGARRQLLAQQDIQLAADAPTPDARGGVQALLAASTDFGHQLSAWLNALDATHRIAFCRASRTDATQ